MMKSLLFSILMLGTLSMTAQVKTPAPSPMGKLSQSVGLTDIDVEYSRPSKKGRTIFGELVPYDQMWRTGANGSTDISFSTDVKINGKELKAGKYALYTIPGASQWTIVFHSISDYWGVSDNYDEADDALRVTATPHAMPMSIETFTIDIGDIKNDRADLSLLWDKTYVSVTIEVPTDELVEKSITSVMNGPSANDYFSSARYYLESNKNLDKAHTWVKKAVEMRPDAFWMVKAQAEIEAALGKYDMAIKTAKTAKMKAQEAGNDHYVQLNEKNIAKWSKM